MITILGSGIAGISASYHLSLLGYESCIYEKQNSWGGLCDNFVIENGFLFDKFVHLSFTKNEYVKRLFSESTPFYSHSPESTNYFQGIWLKHPAQYNLCNLSPEIKVEILHSFISKTAKPQLANYEDWLNHQFGEYFSKHFSQVYTKKYWTKSAHELTTGWIGDRISVPDFKQMLRGSFEEQETNYYYADQMRYPRDGGYKSFLNSIARGRTIKLNKEIVQIDLSRNKIEFSDNSAEYYDTLCSTIPLPELINLIKDCPVEIQNAGNKLEATSGQLVSVGFNSPDIAKHLWFYIYDEDILPARVYSPSLKSPQNAPNGSSSLQFETYFSNRTPLNLIDENIVDHILDKAVQMNLFSSKDVLFADSRKIDYANVIFDHQRIKSLQIINEFFDRNHIFRCGRFGEWKYFWSDQSLLSGKNCSERIAHSFK